ncbi:MAG: hypothetical protein HN413_03060 [Chloroflexi bacterium]|jgi:immune inhibitor A|nr:hypothetical protein [Chloroflexota bacterium]
MNKTLIIVIVVILVLLLCACLCLVLIGGAAVFGLYQQDGNVDWSTGPDTATPVVLRPTPQETPQPADQTLEANATPGVQNQPQAEFAAPDWKHETLQTLEEAVVPVNDMLELAERLGGQENVPLTVAAPPQYQIGEQDVMWLTNVDTNESFQVDVTLQYVTEHVYFWIEDGVIFEADEVAALVETFEREIYPRNREFFGSEWSPGVDNDPHLYIIYASGLGWGLAGYFSSADEYHPLAHEYSNAHEAFVLNSDNLNLSGDFTLGVLAHEFQHMIHWYRDRNESSWLNEGFSELAAFINGYDVGGFDYSYTSNPDLQLNDWPNDSGATGPHYGAGFLFVDYFLNRFGEEATQALVAHPDNGMKSVDAVLEELGIHDSLTNEPISADDFFADWVLASYLQDEKVADGRYTYANYPGAPSTSVTESVYTCPSEVLTRDVSQYGVDYYRIACSGTYNLYFEGSVVVGVLPADPYSGDYAFWSNKGDESDMTLTRSFDFSDHTGPLTLTYQTWYDIEADYDYVYLEASLDGENWEILKTPSGTAEDPSGNSYGWSYNGLSGLDGEWILEEVDISQFAGQQVQLRFEYVTDAAVNGEGFMLDDIAIPEVGYSTDLEGDSGGWETAGFVRIRNELPQTFRLAMITVGDTTTVEMIPLGLDNAVAIPVEIGGDVDEVIFVVSGTTRHTRQRAAYRFELTR